jgi:hypothetical protein
MDLSRAAKSGRADAFAAGAGRLRIATGLPRFWISTGSPAGTHPSTVVVSGFKSRILAVFICDTMRPSTGSMKNALPGW